MGGQAGITMIVVGALCTWPASAQTIERFEVASVRISPQSPTGKSAWSDPGEATFNATNIPLKFLLQMAYEVDEKQIAGDARCGSELYDVTAKPDDGLLTPERLKPMLAALLAERFGLIAHRETRVVSGYALVLAKGGFRLRASEAVGAGQSAILRGRIIGRPADLPQLAAMLARPLGLPVVDKTGLSGTYEIDLKFAPADSVDSSFPSIFTAIQEQLGLKLDSQRVPLNLLVIDRCQRVPTDN